MRTIEQLVDALEPLKKEAIKDQKFDLAEVFRGMQKDLRHHQEMNAWRPAAVAPISENGKWSKRVAAVTNAGNVVLTSYFDGDTNNCRMNIGYWQRPESMGKGEVIKWWVPLPPFDGFNQ